MSQPTDEQQIRALIDTWLAASRAGDLDTLLNLMTDDIAFLTPGNPPMRREDFVQRSRAMEGKIAIEAHAEVQEITIVGDHAICWNYLEIAVTPLPGGRPVKRAGHILSVLRRGADGQWRIWRDANTLTAG